MMNKDKAKIELEKILSVPFKIRMFGPVGTRDEFKVSLIVNPDTAPQCVQLTVYPQNYLED